MSATACFSGWHRTFHRKHNKWPATLGELSPQYLPQLPVDPITGRALHYKVDNDRPLVYSVGADGDDDGGRPTADEVAATLPPTAPKAPRRKTATGCSGRLCRAISAMISRLNCSKDGPGEVAGLGLRERGFP